MSRLTHSLEDIGGWFVAEGQIGQHPMLIRGRTRLGELRQHPFLSRRLTVVWTLTEPGNAGLPQRSESAALEAWEHAFCAALERDGLGLLAFVFTHAGARTWTFYVNDSAEVERRLAATLAVERPLPIRFSSEDDPAWDEYATMIRDTGVSAD